MANSEDWYIINPQPTMNNGLENDEWDNWVFDSFDEALTETRLGETVIFCSGQFNGETGLFETEFETEAIVDNKTFDSYTQGWRRQILTRISDMIADYKYVKIKDTKNNYQIYVIMAMPDSNGIYTKAVVHECNYTLKWQDEETGQIYYYPSYTADATQYNVGTETYRDVIRVGYNQLMSWVSMDEISVELKRDKRMFIDYATKKPDVFRVSSISKVPYSYGEMRVMRITFTETEFNPDTDRIDLMLCDYIDPNDIPVPSEPIAINYKGEPTISIGGKKTFSIDGTWENVVYTLIGSELVESGITLTQTENNKCVLTCKEEPLLVGSVFRLCVDSNGWRGQVYVTIKGAI